MSTALVWKFKWWWIWQDAMHEQWLQDMARQGLHLRKARLFGLLFGFEHGAPADVAYRWDFPGIKSGADYVQLFLDAGWEPIVEVVGWHCWCKPVTAGRAPEIFTDADSMLRKYTRNLYLMSALTIPPAIAFGHLLIDVCRHRHAPMASMIVMGCCVVFDGYVIVRLLEHIGRIRRGRAAHRPI